MSKNTHSATRALSSMAPKGEKAPLHHDISNTTKSERELQAKILKTLYNLGLRAQDSRFFMDSYARDSWGVDVFSDYKFAYPYKGKIIVNLQLFITCIVIDDTCKMELGRSPDLSDLSFETHFMHSHKCNYYQLCVSSTSDVVGDKLNSCLDTVNTIRHDRGQSTGNCAFTNIEVPLLVFDSFRFLRFNRRPSQRDENSRLNQDIHRFKLSCRHRTAHTGGGTESPLFSFIDVIAFDYLPEYLQDLRNKFISRSFDR